MPSSPLQRRRVQLLRCSQHVAEQARWHRGQVSYLSRHQGTAVPPAHTEPRICQRPGKAAPAPRNHTAQMDKRLTQAYPCLLQQSQNWISDETTFNCMNCQSPFNMLNRKHHCRRCGNVICRKCSPHFVFLNDSLRPVRVCQQVCASLVSWDLLRFQKNDCCTPLAPQCESRGISSSVVIRQGSLNKLGGNVKSWKKRWFVLLPGELLYYKNRYVDQLSSKVKVRHLLSLAPYLRRWEEREINVVDLTQGFNIVLEQKPANSFSLILSVSCNSCACSCSPHKSAHSCIRCKLARQGTMGRKYVLRAGDEQERSAWVTALHGRCAVQRAFGFREDMAPVPSHCGALAEMPGSDAHGEGSDSGQQPAVLHIPQPRERAGEAQCALVRFLLSFAIIFSHSGPSHGLGRCSQPKQ